MQTEQKLWNRLSALDDRLSSHGRPLRIIDNATNFDNKLKRLMAEITAFLGEPEPLGTERNFLIEYPDMAALEKCPTVDG